MRWIGFTTFMVRAFGDIVRYSSLTIAPPAVMTALYFVVFGELIGHRVGRLGGFDYEHYIAPGLIMIPVITSSYSQAALSFFTAKSHKLLEEHLVSPQPSWIIVVSYVAGGMMRGILVGLVVGVVALLFTHSAVRHGCLMIGAILLTSLVSSLTGFVNAVFAKSFDQINGILVIRADTADLLWRRLLFTVTFAPLGANPVTRKSNRLSGESVSL